MRKSVRVSYELIEHFLQKRSAIEEDYRLCGARAEGSFVVLVFRNDEASPEGEEIPIEIEGF